ncbi:unnamed protein product [Phaedon cochleariae]|uniref:Cubilin n=1 Tax=Phaedon cochleariae TaxID=80249 RepID=A0A9N9X3X9_PHACE|nr:unnamed protein product [Phaedon cochleariae]
MMIMASMDKNISFVTHGTKSGVSINNVDLLSTLNKAHNATLLTVSYQQTLSTYSDRLEALEQRVSEPIMINNFTDSADDISLKIKIRRLTRRVSLLQRRMASFNRMIFNNDCASNPCQNGATCQDMFGSYLCRCSEGWEGWTTDESGVACTRDVDECKLNHPSCSVNPRVGCINVPGSFYCAPCPAGFSGNGYHCYDVDECATNNGGCSTNPMVLCINTHGSRVCGLCPPGFSGDGTTCTYQGAICSVNNGGCNHLATCRENSRISSDYVECTCPPGYIGTGIGPNGCVRSSGSLHPCTPNPCKNGVCRVNNATNDFICTCTSGYSGRYCDTIRNLCNPNPCLNDGECQSINNNFQCKCKPGFIGALCQNQREACGGLLKAENGTLKFPPDDYEDYNDRSNCAWLISSNFSSRVLNITIKKFDIEKHPSCQADWLEIHDGGSTAAHTLGRFCGNQLPLGGNFITTHNSVYLWFRSDKTINKEGFELTWNAIKPRTPGCGGVYTSTEGKIESSVPPYSMYSTICDYKIQQSVGSKIRVTFLSMELGDKLDCSFNYVKVFEGADDESGSLGRFCGRTLPAPFISQGNQLTIQSSLFSPAKWKLKYEKICGSKYTEKSGSFSALTGDSDCIYQIERPVGNVIMLVLKISMKQFSPLLSEKHRCFSRFVEVRDGDHENATLIGKYCQEETINITSNHNSLWIKLKQRHDIYSVRAVNNAFSAEYTSVDIGCGGIMRNKYGNIASPTHSDGFYPPSMKCTWLIIAPPNHVIQLTWMQFNVEQSYECSYDNVQVFDNNTDLGLGGLMGKFCGFTLPPVLLSSSNTMTIVFTSDITVSMDGFLASYTTIEEENVCGGHYFTAAGVIKSPGYPESYPVNRECSWTINVMPGQQIMLNITDFDIEPYSGCRYDWLEIRNGGTSASPLIGKFCGKTIPKQIPSHANKLYLFFKSDLSRTAHGFKITWSSTATGCGGILNSPTGSIISPHYPEPYSRNTECLWKIITSAGSRIQVIFSDINLEKHATCSADYVQLFDGITINSNSLGKFCYEVVEPVKSTENKMLVKFRSDIAFQGRGFQLHYTTVCKNTVKGFQGVIESPNFPNEYSQDEDCLWEIVVSNRNKINITFSHFELERSLTFANNSCLFDYVEIRYAEEAEEYEEERPYTTYGRYCGDENPGHLSLNSDHVQIHFVSDKLLLGTGFRLEWVIFGCGGHLKKNTGTIASPNYPDPYPTSVECEWLIEVDFGYSVEIEFHEVDVEKESSCQFDSVKVYNGMDSTYNLLSTICKQKKPTVITSTGNFMFVKFASDISYQGRGFTADYKTVETKCGGRFTAAEGSIFSPNYPKNYNKNETCEYLIDVDEGHSIELKFKDLDLYKSENCSRNYVRMHDGPTAGYPVIETVCGNETPNTTIKSSFNNMFIEFRADSSSKGFLAEYFKSCGSRITTQSSGFIEAQDMEFNDNFQTCVWTIVSSDPTKHVSLTITHMHGLLYCDFEGSAVKVYNGESTDSPLLASYCGSKVPPTLVSDGSALTIKIDSKMSFFATYSVYDSQCGGTLTSSEGFFSTPGYPKKYASDTECEWTIQISPGNQLTLNFIAFDILDSENCNSDYLEIRTNNATGPLLGVYCGKNKPNNLTHEGSVWLMFKGSKLDKGSTSVAAKGFYAEYILNEHNELTGVRGDIYSPLYPQPILEYKVFDWKITVGLRKRILLTFKEFYLDATDYTDDSCYFASFEVFDGVDDTGTSLGKYCGISLPKPIKSSSNIMFIKVEYSSPRLGSKFRVSWEEIAASSPVLLPIQNKNCSNITGEINLRSLGNYTFTSPGYPGGYAPNLNCEWIFSTVPMNHLAIAFIDINFDTNVNRIVTRCEVFSDYVRLYQRHSYDNDWQVMKDICRKDDALHLIHAAESLKVQFVSTRLFNGTGFRAIVYDLCGGTLTDSTGYIVFNESNSRISECQWNITVRSTKTIQLTFEMMNINHDKNKGCDNFLMIRNGKYSDSPILGNGKYCGTELPDKLTSTGNNLFIKYKGSENIVGFRLKYEEVSASCGGEIILSLYDHSTEISSPNYPNIPNPHIECQWLIRSPPGESLRIDFEERFDLTPSRNCETEYVEVRDGGTEFSRPIGKYCKSAPSSQFSTDNMMFVKFFTDTDDPKNGFKARVSIGQCGGTIRGDKGDLSFASPANAKNLNCTWRLSGLTDHYLTTTFSSVVLNGPCSKNYIRVYENMLTADGSRTENELGKFCGKNVSTKIASAGNQMFVNFVGDNDGKFSLSFNSSRSQCGGTINEESGEILSPGYPVMNHFNRYCKWTIVVPEGRRIILNFIDLDFDSSFFSQEQAVAIFDGKEFSVRKAFLIKGEQQKTIESSANVMTILFWSSNPSEHRGFKANFSSNEPTICLGDFSKESGIISTPQARNTSYNCHWTHTSGDMNLRKTTAMAITVNTNYKKSLTSSYVCGHSFVSLTISNQENENLNSVCSTTESQIITRSPFLTTKLKAQVSHKYELNFTASYSTHDCGGILTGQSGMISSPNFPNKPSKTFECAWLLRADEGQTINITVLSSNLGDDCEKSFLAIHNGGLPTHPRIGKYCRNAKPDPILSQGREVWIEYRWEQGSTGTGFQLKYEATSKGCGGVFHDKSRTIQTPNYGSDYPNNAECLWLIESLPGYHIELNFTGRFHIEESVNCTNDYLEVFDWRDEGWTSLGKHCGRIIPSNLKSSSEKMKILFRTNDKITANGFKLIWTWQCGGTFIASKVPRVIVSPGYPMRYEGNLKCDYTIQTKSDVLNLRFLDFELEIGEPECKFDNVSINGYNYARFAVMTKQVYCGDKLPPSVRMRGNAIVSFKTDPWLSRKGFKLEYADESCGGDIKEETIIESKQLSGAHTRYPLYLQPKIKCLWNITAPTNQIVVLAIKELHMRYTPMCFGQSVEIFNDQENKPNRLAQLCGDLRDEYPLISTSNKMIVKLQAMPNSYEGFKAEVRFSHGPAEGCGGTINLTETKYIQSPNLNNLDCAWIIIAPRDYQVQIEFTKLNLISTCGGKNESYLPCDCSHIEVRDGRGPFSELVEKICPSSNVLSDTRPITTFTNTAFLRILLRGKKEDAFKATIKPIMSVCGSSVLIATNQIKNLTSPNYPNPYPPNIKCTYSISTPNMFDRISLHFIEFDLTNGNKKEELYRCTGDNIQIYEDPHSKMISEGLGPNTVYNGGSKSLSLSYNDVSGRHLFCGSDRKPFDYYSNGKAISLSLVSSNSMAKGRGFKLEYSLAGCNRNYTELQGRINNGNDRRECHISIVVPDNMTISLYFSSFYMFHSVNCTDQAFEVRDGSPDGKILLTACGYRVPDPVFSFTNKLYVHQWSHRVIGSLMRFDFVYTSTTEGRGCGGELYNSRGKIYSPMYPNPFRNDTICTWTIKVPVGLHAVLKFNILDIQGSCEQTNIKVVTHAGYDDVVVNTFEICKDVSNNKK